MPNYIPAKNLTLTINGAIVTATTSNISDEIGEVDVTNLASGGNYELIVDIKKCSLDFECVMDQLALPSFTNGTQVPASWVMASGHTYSGTLVVLSQQHKGGARGAYTVSGKATFTGSVTRA